MSQVKFRLMLALVIHLVLYNPTTASTVCSSTTKLTSTLQQYTLCHQNKTLGANNDYNYQHNNIALANIKIGPRWDDYDLRRLIEQTEDPYAWRLDYMHEQTANEIKVLRHERSIDERFANIIYVTRSIKLFNSDTKLFNVGNQDRSLRLELEAADSRVDDDLCGKQLEQILDLIREISDINKKMRLSSDHMSEFLLGEKHIKLAYFLDSFGHYDSGLLSGKTIFVGMYNQCKRTSLILGEQNKPVETRYCTALLSPQRYLDQRLRKRPKLETEERNLIEVGICMPASCHSKSFQKHRLLIGDLVGSQFKLPRTLFLKQNLHLESLYCEIEGDSSLIQTPLSGKIFIGLILGWLALIFYCSFIHKQQYQAEATSSFIDHWFVYGIQCLNLKRSFEDFICKGEDANTVKTSERRVNLNVLNPIKILCSFVVILGHSFLVAGTVVADLPFGYAASESDPLWQMLLSATLVTDTFYVITGILVTFVSMHKLEKFYQNETNTSIRKPSTWILALKHLLQIIAIRYTRLVPLYALVFWFHKSLFLTLSSGPLWDHGYNRNTEAGACRQESWLTPLTPLAAFQPLARQCLPHSWSIAGDIFFIFILAPIILLLIRKPKLAVLISGILSLLSAAAMYSCMRGMGGTLRDAMLKLKYYSLVLIFSNSSNLYTVPHFRLYSVLIGAMAGYCLHEQSKKKNLWSKFLVGWPTKTAAYFIPIMISLPAVVIILQDNLLYYLPIHAYLLDVALTFGRLIWSLSNAIIFFRMMTDWQDSYLMRNFASLFWKSLAKLCFGILLVHLDIIYFDLMSHLSFPVFQRYQTIKLTLYCFITCLPISLALHLLFENPLDKLFKGLTNGLPQNMVKKDTKECLEKGNEQKDDECEEVAEALSRRRRESGRQCTRC